jgi:hypothetical protein
MNLSNRPSRQPFNQLRPLPSAGNPLSLRSHPKWTYFPADLNKAI